MRKTSLLKTIAFVLLAGAFVLGARPSEAQVAVNLPDRTARAGTTGDIPITVGDLTGEDVISYEFTISYDESVVELTGVTTDGTLSEGSTPVVNATPGELRVSFAQATPLSGSGTLINIDATFESEGTTELTFENFQFNEGDPAVDLVDGGVSTVTVVERALFFDDDLTAFVGQEDVLIPVRVDALTEAEDIISFEFNVSFDPTVLDITGVETSGTLSEGFSTVPPNEVSAGEVRIVAAGTDPIVGEGTLIYLVADVVGEGTSDLTLSNVQFNEGAPVIASIPGVITVSAGEAFEANLAPFNEVPPRSGEIGPFSSPSGSATATQSGGTLTLTGSFSGLSSAYTASHIHIAETGENGPIVIPLTATVDADGLGGTWEAASNTFSPADSLIEALRNGRLYVNVHTENFPPGEIRGQLLDAPNSAPEAVDLTSPSEDDVFSTPGSGNMVFEWPESTDPDGDKVVYVGQVGIDPDFTVFVDTLVGTATSFELSEAEIEDLFSILDVGVDEEMTLYFRVNAQDGSLRALGGTTAVNFLRVFEPEFSGFLSGMNEAPPVYSTGSGVAFAAVSGSDLIVGGSFDDLAGELIQVAGTSAHIHLGHVGEDGPVVVPLNVDADDDNRGGVLQGANNTFNLETTDLPEGWDADSLEAALEDGQLYVNVHTTAYPAGELRAQLLSIPNDAPPAVTISDPADAVNFTAEGDKDATLYTASWDDIDDNGEHLAYIYQVATSASFADIVVSKMVTEAEVDVTVRQGLDLLEDHAGDGAGASVTLFHRVITTDGSRWTAGDETSITLTRGETGQNVAAEDSEMPAEFALRGNYPNPFNPSTTLRFDLPETAEVSVVIVDALGRTVHTVPAQTVQGGADRTVNLNAGSLASGTYLYRVVAKGASQTMVQAGTMTLVK